MKQPKSIGSLFALPGFVSASALGGAFGDPGWAQGLVDRIETSFTPTVRSGALDSTRSKHVLHGASLRSV